MVSRQRFILNEFFMSFTDQFGRIGRCCLAIPLIFILSGCAAQLAYRDGQELVAQGKREEGLVKFQEAVAQDPRVTEYKEAYIQTREAIISDFMERGRQQEHGGHSEESEKYYRKILAIDPDNGPAKERLRSLGALELHAAMYKEAEDAWQKKDWNKAKATLRDILSEDPNDAKAIKLNDLVSKEIAKSAAGESVLSAAYRKPITIEFKDIAIKQLFEVISHVSGLNFLFDKDVNGNQKTSIFLRNSNIETAIHFALLSNQLEMQILDPNTVLVYANTPEKLKKYQELVVKTFFLTNADAKSVANTLKTIIKSKDIVVDEKLNMVIVRDSPAAIDLAEKLVALQDVPEPEVMLEVEILEVKRTRLLELGIGWPETMSLTPLSSTSGGTLTVNDLRGLNGRTIGVGIAPVKINARQDDTDTRILANPRIRARNHEKAKIMIGDRVPSITTTSTATGFSSESINYIDVGLKLEVQPTVYLDNDVSINISLEVSNIVSQFETKSGSLAYQIGTRNASTVLRLKDGENQVLAGLINAEDRSSANKIPALGDIPLLGRLFGSTNDDNQKTEIVLSITPHIVRNIRRPDATRSEFQSGTESSFRIRPRSISEMAKEDAAKPEEVPNSVSSVKKIQGKPANDTADVIKPFTLTGENAQLDWQGPAAVKEGEIFKVQLNMQSAKAITSLPMVVGYDKKVLRVESIAEGGFLKEGGVKTNFSSRVNPDSNILITGSRSGSGGAKALGNVATITFRAMTTASTTSINVITAAATGIGGSSIDVKVPAPYTIHVE